MPRVIDAHLHLDERVPGPAASALKILLQELDAAKVERGILLHLATQRWPAEEIAAAVRPVRKRLLPLLNVHPFAPDAKDILRHGIETLGFRGLKLHPRLQHYSIDDDRTTALVTLSGELGVPVVIDAFPDGNWLEQGFDPLAFARLARHCPTAKIVVAHMGGHRVLDFLMLAKRMPNLYFDVSFSLLYYRSSTIPQDMLYAIRSLRFTRVFYGSDYPDRKADVTLKESIKTIRTAKPTKEELDSILYANAKEFFPWEC